MKIPNCLRTVKVALLMRFMYFMGIWNEAVEFLILTFALFSKWRQIHNLKAITFHFIWSKWQFHWFSVVRLRDDLWLSDENVKQKIHNIDETQKKIRKNIAKNATCCSWTILSFFFTALNWNFSKQTQWKEFFWDR